MNQTPNYTMTLTGHGKIAATPDLALIRLGVQTTGSQLTQIQSENAQISQQVIGALGQMGITEIKTIQYTIDKLYEYVEGKQIDKGYIVQNMFEIKTKNMNQIGMIIDTAVNMGANKVDSITFTLEDADLYYKHALNLAVNNAIQKAKSIAANLKIYVNDIPIRITEGGAPAVPMQQFQREVAATPILPGNLDIEAFVTAEFTYT